MASLSADAPPAHEARPLTAAKPKDEAVKRRGTHDQTLHSPNETLEARCRSVISANLERYPANALGILSEEMWDSIVRERNIKTTPNGGTGGLDGTGRLLPAIPDRFMTQVEESNPHFADSAVADRLVWSDCVEYRFRSGGLTRPAVLRMPWPVLVNKLKRSGDTLIELLSSNEPSERNQELFELHVQTLSDSPMNVSLLQASGVGKSVKKFIKTCAKKNSSSLDVHTERITKGSQSAVSPLVQLEQTLQRWKQMAANSGVQIQTSEKDMEDNKETDEQTDMRLAETCQSWRQLFVVLQQREEKRRAEQGERMRKIRSNLASGRPKVIKVRPTKSRHESILEKTPKGTSFFASSSSSAAKSGNAKMQALKKESKIATTLQKSSARPSSKKKHSFGDAVAFASTSKPNSATKRRGGQLVPLGGGKSMRLPTGKRQSKDASTSRPPLDSLTR